jgi:glutamate-1-semialdehyde 2,1-aminomutase
LEPDVLVLGKPIASGIPAAAYGFTSELAARIQARLTVEEADTGGIGGTLAGNALSLAAMRATLKHVLTPAFFERTLPLAERFAQGVESVVGELGLPWIVKRLGCRVEYWFRAEPPRNGGEAAAAVDAELDRYMHLCALNRGILMTPFHNMALVCADTSEDDIDRHTRVFAESVDLLLD